MLTDYWKGLVLNFSEWGIQSFLSQKVNGKMIFVDYWKVIVLNFLDIGNMVLFESKNWWKDDIYCLLESPCFELSGDGKYGLFWTKMLTERWHLLITEKFLFWNFWRWEIWSCFSQKVDGKMMFTWPFWAFNDIPGFGKYGFL